jgi:hypothetical protein
MEENQSTLKESPPRGNGKGASIGGKISEMMEIGIFEKRDSFF